MTTCLLPVLKHFPKGKHYFLRSSLFSFWNRPLFKRETKTFFTELPIQQVYLFSIRLSKLHLLCKLKCTMLPY